MILAMAPAENRAKGNMATAGDEGEGIVAAGDEGEGIVAVGGIKIEFNARSYNCKKWYQVLITLRITKK